MITAQESQQLQQNLSNARTVLILLGQNPSYDAVASASSLHLALQQAGKEVSIASSADMRVEFSHIVGVESIKKEIGNRDLVVSFDYEDGAVEKVSYNISEDGKRFNLVVAPKATHKPIDPSNISYSYAGVEADMIFLFEASSFEELGSIFDEEPELFHKAFTVSIHSNPVQPYAKLMLDTSGQSSLAEGIAELLRSFGMEPKEDIATNLLSSIEKATHNFQSLNVSANTFELVASLLRNGGRRTSQEFVGKQMNTQETMSFAKALRARPTMAVPGQAHMQQHIHQPHMAPQHVPQPPVQQASQHQPTAPFVQPHQQQVQNEQQIHQIQHSIQQEMQKENAESLPGQQQNPPKEWLQPKIFTGTSEV